MTKTLMVRIEPLRSVGQSVAQAMKSGAAEKSAGLSFLSYEDMHRTLSPKRLDIIRSMASKEVLAYREVARIVGRDFKAVHSDLTALINAGVIDRTENGVVFPYDTIHFEFDIRANAA
jgi:predicted transcriptional regulator